MPKNRIIFIFVVVAIIFFIFAAHAFDLPKWFSFNQQNALQEWQEKVFKDRVFYTVQVEKGGGYLSAKSNRACSGLFYKIKFDIHQLPMMSWNWKVLKFPEKKSSHTGNIGWLERDDYAARVYVIFSSWNFMNTKSLEYIWDEKLPEDTIMTSPYLQNIRLIVVKSGKDNAEQWIFEERNIYDDYKKAFGKTPPRFVTAIALMTDADNTLSTAEASYKDLKVGYKK